VLHAQATKHVITAGGTSFSPNDIPNVVVGDTVRWEWNNGDHTTTSTTVPAGAATWNSPLNSITRFFEYPVSDDSDLCTTDSCTSGNCVFPPITCDDGDTCTTDACNNGICEFTPIPGCGVGIREISEANLRVFPNPASDELTIEGASAKLTRVSLSDVSGKQVYDSGEINTSIHNIGTSTLPEGVYLLHVYTGDGEAVGKVYVDR
jgi:hypothetical protein